MLIPLLLAATLAAPQQNPVADSARATYATAAVRAVVEQAAVRNATPPPSLGSYAARVETEFALTITEPENGTEMVFQLEQIASDFFWRSDGAVAQEVVGYRSQMSMPAFSALGSFRIPFLVPTLYANRLVLIRSLRAMRRDSAGDAVHPFAAEREAFYRFSGGDTVDVLELPTRRIPIVRIHVVPLRDPGGDSLFYEGDIDLDATRFHIVRMRGRLVPKPRPGGVFSRFFRGVTYVHLENAEYDEDYWLPREQRFEGQSYSSLHQLGVSFRGVSRFVRVTPDDPRVAARLADADSAPYGRITTASSRELDRFHDWSMPLGSLTEAASARDFDAYAPQGIRPGGRPDLRFGVRHTSQLIHYNSVEGWFTGVGFIYRHDPRYSLRMHGGYAWSEQTVRGGGELLRRDGRWEAGIHAERALLTTIGYRTALEPEEAAPPSAWEPVDSYIDRRIAGLTLRYRAAPRLLLRTEIARAADRNAWPTTRSAADSLDVAGRAAVGDYWLLRAAVLHNPAIALLSVQPGLGWSLRYERAMGDVARQRVAGSLNARIVQGPWAVHGGVNAGVTVSSRSELPSLLESDGTTLDHSDSRRVAGRWVFGSSTLTYALPVLRAPVRLGRLVVPGAAPSLSTGAAVDWMGGSDRCVMDGFAWSTTSGACATIDARLRFFGGPVSVGVARPLADNGRWSFVWSFFAGY